MVDKYGPKRTTILGSALLVPALALLRVIHTTPDRLGITLYCILLSLGCFGLGFLSTPSFVESNVVIEKYYKNNPDVFGDRPPLGALYGIYLTAFGGGATIGPVCAGALGNSVGYGNMNAVLAGMVAAAAICSYVWLGGKPDWMKRQ